MTAEIQFSFFQWNTVYAHILKDNKPVQSLLRNLGFELCQGEEKNFNQKHFNTRESFLKHSAKIKKAVKLLTNNDETSTFLVETSELNDSHYQQWEAALLSHVRPDKVEETEAGRIYYFS